MTGMAVAPAGIELLASGDDEREYHVAPSEDEVPFHIPRD